MIFLAVTRINYSFGSDLPLKDKLAALEKRIVSHDFFGG
jgi:hypothetical protein